MVLTMFPVPFSAGNLFHAVSKIWAAERERESSRAHLLKSIPIARDPPCVESLIPMFDGSNFLGSKQAFKKQANWNGRSWEKRIILIELPIGLSESVSLWEWRVQNIKRIAMADFKTNGLSVIFNIEADPRPVSFVFPVEDQFRRYRNISSQLVFGGLISSFHQTTSGEKQESRGGAQNDGENRNDAFRIDPFNTAAPRKRAPFLPVFCCGAATWFLSFFVGKYLYDRGEHYSGWQRRCCGWGAGLIVILGSVSFVFGFPWAAIF